MWYVYGGEDMIYKNIISKEQALEAIEKGEFGTDITSSKSNVIIILTQDWCPQWRSMKSWIYNFETELEIDIYELEYNKESYFKKFMKFKESIFQNYDVPYLRYYKDGKLIAQTNYINKNSVLEIIDK